MSHLRINDARTMAGFGLQSPKPPNTKKMARARPANIESFQPRYGRSSKPLSRLGIGPLSGPMYARSISGDAKPSALLVHSYPNCVKGYGRRSRSSRVKDTHQSSLMLTRPVAPA